MPQISVNSTNIISFGFALNIDIYNRSMTFETGDLTTYNSGGISAVGGIAFSLQDSVGLDLLTVDWDSPQIIPATDTSYTLDLSTSPVNFFFQKYKIIGYIKDADGTVYQTIPVIKNVGTPVGVNESGYVDGLFAVIPDCINNTITVKEFTPFVYCNKTPLSVTKDGILSYPTGTIAAIDFAGTPFSNDEVYTGEYRVNCESVATYDLGDDIYVLVTYITNQPFPVTCSNFIGDITCCLSDVYNTYLKNCENAVGQAALQKYNSVFPSILNGLVKQINGKDASIEVAYIKKTLNCNCGTGSVRQNEATPTNPAIYSIVLNGVGGTTISSPTITGNTKTFNIASNSYVIGKGDTGDLAYTLSTTTVGNVTTTKITFNYDNQALYNLNAIAASPTLLNQLNSLVTGAGGGSIIGLDGKCVIDLTTASYAVSQTVNSSTLITQITINGVVHAAPTNLFATDVTSIASWLNSLSLGTFTAVYNSSTLTIQSVGNTNTVSTITFTTPNITKQFSATNATLVQVLQAIINWMCNQTALQVALGNNLNLCYFDYNGDAQSLPFTTTNTQNDYNAGVASVICNIVSRMNTLTSVTCTTLKAIFIDRPSTSFGANDRLYGTLGGDCAGLSDLQIANLVIAAVGKYTSVKTAWCAIDCTVPATCPDISNTSLAMSGANIGVYGLTWAVIPTASQTVTVRYRIAGTLTYTVATNNLLILPNGNISGTTPFLIGGLTVGTTYDVFIQNNCGGSGFVKQITTPTGSVYPGNYLLDNVIYNICGEATTTLYSSSPFASGITMYTDNGLTVPVTGYTYITISGSNIFEINTSTGVVGIDTGSACSNGTAGSYLLGNDTGTICAGSPSTLYTDGSFGVGKTIYTDSALTTPQTGYSYIVSGGVIYTLNSSTGVVTGTSGLTCSTLTATLSRSGGSGSGTLSVVISGGTAPYSYTFGVNTAGPCEAHTITTPTGTTSDLASTTYTVTLYATTTYNFYCSVIDSSSNSVISNTITNPACLVPETMIMLKDGSEIPLSECKEGTELFEENGVANKVESWQELESGYLYILNDGLLKTSDGHVNIIIDETEEKEIQSIDLMEGDMLPKVDGSEIEISSIEVKEGKFKVINIVTTTERFVANGIITHNKFACP